VERNDGTSASLAVAGVLLGTVLQAVDLSVVNVAIPEIQTKLGGSLAQVGWVVTGYAIASLVAMPLCAGIAARTGMRAYFAAQVVTFTAASAACALARTAPALIAFRVLQGFSAGGLLPLSQGILMTLFTGERRGTAVALVGFAAVLGPLFGPPLGGVLTDRFGWPSIFWINVPLGLLSAALVLKYLRVDAEPKREPLDVPGAVLLAAAVVSLQVACAHHAWLFAPAALFGALFVARERRAASPAVDLSVVRHRPLAATLVSGPLYGFGLYASAFLVPLLLERELGMTATATGVCMAAGAVASGTLIACARFLLRTFRARALCTVGAALFGVAMLIFAWVALRSSGEVYLPQVLRGAGTGLLYIGMNGFAFGAMRDEDLSTSASLFYLVRQLGGTIGVALAADALDSLGQRGMVGALVVLALTAPASLLPIRAADRRARAGTAPARAV
jgi:MFS transporter, DHA2 family, multidrug resistance protein